MKINFMKMYARLYLCYYRIDNIKKMTTFMYFNS